MEHYELVPQGISAELIASSGRSLAEQDALGLRSHRLAARPTDDGRFDREIIPIEADGELRTTDQGIRCETTLEALATLKPAFEEDGTVTAGNSSRISDGAAAVLLMVRDKADELALTPRAGIVDTTRVGVEPVVMLTGLIPATRTLLERNGMTIGDLDLNGDRDDVEATGGERAQEVGRVAHADRLPTAVAQRLDRAAPRRRLNRPWRRARRARCPERVPDRAPGS